MTQELSPAPLWQRALAAVYDLLPLLAIWFITAAVSMLATRGELDHHSLWYRLVLLGVTAAYFVTSWTHGGQTIGLRAWRLRLVGDDGGAVSLPRALLRFAVAWLSLLVFGLGFLWAIFEPQRRTWHDLAAKTWVVRRA